MGFEEHPQQRFQRNLSGVEDHLNDFGMAGGSGADLFVRGIGILAPAVAGFHLKNPLNARINGFCAPKASSAKGYGIGDFRRGR